MLKFHISFVLFIRRIYVLTEPNQPNTAAATEKKTHKVPSISVIDIQ